ncbi:MAG: universal stress protein [Dehalococcoidales bacterium]|nr:MAG: universal stress protein [Dehalococcoidales bacterium]
MYKRILVPLDGSKMAEEVIPHAITLATECTVESAEVVLLMVFEVPHISPYHPGVSMPLNWEKQIKQITDDAKKTARSYLNDVKKRFKNTGIKVRVEVMEGEPADKIIEYNNKNSFDVIVMVTHGRSWAKRWAFGSVADKVLHGVTNPILLVRAH